MLRLTYHLLAKLRHLVLMSVFGYASHCPHHPTCGEYWLNCVENIGWFRGSMQGLRRVAHCWGGT